MAFSWADIFVPPIGDSGNFDSGDYTSLDEWPFSVADIAARQLAGSGTDTIGLDFDLSAGPGDKKGVWIWVQWVSQQSGGYTITAVRLIDNNGPTTLWEDSSPGITVPQDSTARIHAIRVSDSAFSGDPDLDDLTVEFDIRNDHGSSNQLRFTGIRLSKSPFTSAQEAFLPPDLDGQDFSCYRASDLAVLGAVDTEAIVVWPDSSGNGRHLLRTEGTFPTYNADTIDYVSFSNSSGSRFNSYWGPAVTGNHIHHTQIYPTLTAVTQSPWSHAGGQFHGFAITQKSILGQDFTGGVNNWVMMSGDGSPGVHLRTTDISLNTWQRVTEWVQDAGNEHMWLDDDASPAIDAASGANNMVSLSMGAREDSTLFFEGRIAEHWWIDGSGITEGDIDGARDDWVAGFGGSSATTLIANEDGTIADVVDEIDTTVDLYLSVDDAPGSPNDADWINNQKVAASVFLELSATPGDFLTALSAGVVVRYRGQNWSGGSKNLYARLYESDESTPLSDEVLVAAVTGSGSFANSSEVVFTSLNTSANKATWDAARIRFRWA